MASTTHKDYINAHTRTLMEKGMEKFSTHASVGSVNVPFHYDPRWKITKEEVIKRLNNRLEAVKDHFKDILRGYAPHCEVEFEVADMKGNEIDVDFQWNCDLPNPFEDLMDNEDWDENLECSRCHTFHCDEDDDFHHRELFISNKDSTDICRHCVSEEDDEDEDEDDDWMEIYSQHETFKAFCGDHEHLKPYHDFRYFQCWGGGDEGGFIMNDKDETYKVNRGWFQPFTVEPVDGILDIGHRGGVEHLRVIPKPCEMECVGAAGAPPCNAIVKGGDTICDECFKYVKPWSFDGKDDDDE